MPKNAVRDLLLSNSLLSFDEIMQLSPVGMALLNFDGTYESVNDAYCNIYGYTKKEMLGKSFTMVFQENLRATILELHQRFLTAVQRLAANGTW